MEIRILQNIIRHDYSLTRGQVISNNEYPTTFLEHLLNAGVAERYEIKIDPPPETKAVTSATVPKKKPSRSSRPGRRSRRRT